MDVYTARLFTAPAFSGGPVVQYTAPAGFLTVVTCIAIVWGNALVSGLDAWVQLSDLTKLLRVTQSAGLQDSEIYGGSLVQEGRWAVLAGETLATQTADGTVDFYATGYQLSLP